MDMRCRGNAATREELYIPHPIDISDVVLPGEIAALVERIAENTHDVWAMGRIAEGWVYGERRDDVKKTTPCLIPYRELPESEKDFDRNTEISVIKLLLKLGYQITRRKPEENDV